MKRKKDDLDKLTEKLLKKDPSLKEEFERADRAWDIAFQIRSLREKRGLTQKELAKLAGISQPNVARIESADYQGYTLRTLEKISGALSARVNVMVVPEETPKKDLPRPVFGV